MGTFMSFPMQQLLAMGRNVAPSAGSQATPPQDDAPSTPAPAGLTGGTTPAPQDLLQIGVPGTGETQNELLYYRSEMQTYSLRAQLAQAAAASTTTADGATQTQQSAAQQLTFEFYSESRTEELAMFRQRVGDVAAGLPEGQQQSFYQVSSQTAMRFSMSMSISAETLQGFAGGAEALQGGSEEAMDNFIRFAKDALAKADEIFNEMFKLVHGLLKGMDSNEFQQKLDKFMKELQKAFGQVPGQLTAPGQQDGTVASSQSLQIQIEFQFEYTETRAVGVKESDPIALDLDGDGIELTSHQFGAEFDITASGQAVTTAFVTGGDAFLAMDRNGNGVIDDGSELFGDQRGAANGYAELMKLDSNKDGRIDRQDADFGRLLLFRDNGNAKTEKGELMTLDQAGIAELGLGYKNVNEAAAGGNRIAQTALFKRYDGSYGTTADAILKYRA